MPPTNTKPPGARTGLVVDGCYAGPLKDCGGTLDREHYVSKNVLEQFGKNFTIKGPPWAPTHTQVSAKSLRARVLCKRHNNALSGLDKVAGRFYPLMLAAVKGRHVGEHEFDGEDLERWALKLMLGVAASGNTSYAGAAKLGADEIPEEYLRVLFGDREMRPNCGFKFSQAQHCSDVTVLNWDLNHFIDGPAAGQIFGITIKIANWFQFLTTVTVPVDVLNGVRLVHRPTGFIIGVPEEQGHVKLRWQDRPYGGSFILRRRIVPTSVASAP